jgi:hypothetical protein
MKLVIAGIDLMDLALSIELANVVDIAIFVHLNPDRRKRINIEVFIIFLVLIS